VRKRFSAKEAVRRLTFQGFCPDLATNQLLSGDEVVALAPKAFQTF
jgi:hypothetical protein